MDRARLVPRGTGVFLRRLNRRQNGTPQKAAARAADHGLSWVTLMAIAAGARPERYEPVEASLEDVFLAVVGGSSTSASSEAA